MIWLLAQATTAASAAPTTAPTSAPASSVLGGGFWMPTSASTVAPGVDWLFNFIFWITVFFFVLITVLLVAFVIKYRYREGKAAPSASPAHNTALELTWTIIPTIIVIVIFYYGFRGFLDMSVIPPDAYEINVNAKMWSWSFIYPNGVVSNELHMPVNVPVRLVLDSSDVIHSLYIPQFRVKKDVVPGRYNRFWVKATLLSPPEGFDIFCAEYCGMGHSRMLSHAHVQKMDDFKAWLEREGNWETRMTPAEAGKMLYDTRGCKVCHSIDGIAGTGPSLKNVFGETITLADGSTVVADENYIRESLFEPNAKIVKGFTPQMPTFKGQMKDKDVGAIIEFLKSISDKHKSQTLQLGTTTAPTTAPAKQ